MVNMEDCSGVRPIGQKKVRTEPGTRLCLRPDRKKEALVNVWGFKQKGY